MVDFLLRGLRPCWFKPDGHSQGSKSLWDALSAGHIQLNTPSLLVDLLRGQKEVFLVLLCTVSSPYLFPLFKDSISMHLIRCLSVRNTFCKISCVNDHSQRSYLGNSLSLRTFGS